MSGTERRAFGRQNGEDCVAILHPLQRAKREVCTAGVYLSFSLLKTNKGFEHGGSEHGERKKTVRGTVFADVGNECEARGEGGAAAEKIPCSAPKIGVWTLVRAPIFSL